MESPAVTSKQNIKQVGKFGLIGLLNTTLDFAIFNILFALAGIDVRVANIISTTIAMIFSFFANQRIVFVRGKRALWKQAIMFYAVTAFGLYILQTGTIHILTDVWTMPMHILVSLVHAIGLGRIVSDTFVINNGAKVVGTVVSLTWNYLTYKKVVFL